MNVNIHTNTINITKMTIDMNVACCRLQSDHLAQVQWQDVDCVCYEHRPIHKQTSAQTSRRES